MTNAEALAWINRELDYLRRAPELNGCDMTPEWVEQIEVYTIAAQAIREHDAAVADIERRCYNCKHWNTGLKQSPCAECYIEPKGYYSHINWTWRGLSRAEKTSDHEGKE